MIIIRHLNQRNFYRAVSRLLYVFDWSSKKEFYSLLKRHQDLFKTYENERHDHTNYILPMWEQNKQEISRNFLEDFSYGFLNNRVIRMAMFMDYAGEQQENELDYLESVMGKQEMKSLIKEDRVGHPTLTNFRYWTSHNSIHHLCHLEKFIEHTKTDLLKVKTLVEWGGGYGNIARIFRKINPDTTYIIIDLPIFSFIQSLYLSTVEGAENVNLLLGKDSSILPGKINIVPLEEGILERLAIRNADVFLSTWALSESSLYSIDKVGSLSFFGADKLLLAHQAKSNSTPYSEEIIGRMEDYAITHHEKIPLLKNNYYLFAAKK
ncbi:MAG: hypothetical protein JWN89_735 [Parcubacteria group bacterium]|nr:hypothetical protein [Parcubacteria group bacterium]